MSKNVLDKYRVIAQLGRGGMADVYLAAAHGSGGFSKLLVVKVLQAELARTGEFLSMFRDEARLAARLNHPNIVQTYEVGESEGKHFISMEYLEGQPLNRVMEKLAHDEPLAMEVTFRILIDALSGLHYAHELRDFSGTELFVVHRDITPHNVFVTYEGQIKIVDFGIAKAFDSTTHTKVGTVKGKVAYMAPEQARGEAVTRTADIFSMGVLAWELLVGGRLWEGLTDIAVIGRLVHGDIPDLRTVRVDLPQSLSDLVMRALSPNPAQRPQTAEEFQKGLELEMQSVGAPLTNRRLGELMRAAFRDQRAQVRDVIRKQLERIERDTPSGAVPLAGVRSVTSGAADMPVIGDGGSVHDAPTTIQTGITSAHLDFISTQSPTGSTHAAVEATARELTSRNRHLTWIALIAVCTASLAVGITAPWKALETNASSSQSGLTDTHNKEVPVSAISPHQAAARSSCTATNKPLVELTGEIVSDARLSCDKNYLLRFNTFVAPGTTLFIEAGTQILGDHETKAALIVQPGARIEARGRPDAPIVFTSSVETGKKAGDWGGVIILGSAPINLKDRSGAPMQGEVEGLTGGGTYGGSNPNDSSGVLSYIRIEYGGIEIAPNNEVNGLTFAGVGRGTVVDHIQVRHAADDCFEFFGGNVDAKYLVCQYPDDDAFDWDYGYTGRLQFLVGQSDPQAKNGSHGFEGDNDPSGSKNSPVSAPTIYNVTLCGKNRRVETLDHFGILLRRGSELKLRNALFTGFSAGLDVQDHGTKPNIAASIFFQNLIHNFAYPESPTATFTERLLVDDDHGFDELNYMTNRGLRITDTDPAIGNCFDSHAPDFKPRVALIEQAAIPPSDGFFDSTAQYVGAFRDRNDNWDAGSWVVWSD